MLLPTSTCTMFIALSSCNCAIISSTQGILTQLDILLITFISVFLVEAQRAISSSQVGYMYESTHTISTVTETISSSNYNINISTTQGNAYLIN